MSDVADRARFGARFGARFLSVPVITGTEIKHAPGRALFMTSDISLIVGFRIILHQHVKEQKTVDITSTFSPLHNTQDHKICLKS